MHNTETLKPGRYTVQNGDTYTSQVWEVTAERVTVYTAPAGVYPSVLLGTMTPAEALGVLSRLCSAVLAFEPEQVRTIGKAAAYELHKELGRLRFRDHYGTAAAALERPVSSLAELTAEESNTVRSYARGQWGLPA